MYSPTNDQLPVLCGKPVIHMFIKEFEDVFGNLNNQQVHYDSINQKANDEERLYCHEEHVFEGQEEDPDRQNPHDVCVITRIFMHACSKYFIMLCHQEGFK